MIRPGVIFLYLMIIMLLTTMITSPVLVHSVYSQKAAATDAISVLSSSSLRDDTGAYHIVGEVKNNSPTDSMNHVKIVATLFDSSGKVIGTDFTYSNVDALRPAEKSPFEIILIDLRLSQKVGDYKLSVSGNKTQPLPTALKLSVDNSYRDSIGFYHVAGEVTNQGTQKAIFVKVSGTFYNSSGSVVAADFTYTDPKDLEPGQTAPFEIVITSAASTANKIAYALANVGSDQYLSITQNKTSKQ
jgi:hypothetical protein